MRSQFDGLRSILGNTPVPIVDAPAVEEPPVAAPPVPADVLADLPDLSDLDRGLHKGDSKTVQPDAATAFNALAAHAANHHPSNADTRAFERRKTYVEPERTLNTWTAVAVMAFGLVLGGAAAMALFHDDVTHILAALDGSSTSRPARAK